MTPLADLGTRKMGRAPAGVQQPGLGCGSPCGGPPEPWGRTNAPCSQCPFQSIVFTGQHYGAWEMNTPALTESTSLLGEAKHINTERGIAECEPSVGEQE